MFSFPNPVNEVAARVVAAGVVLLSVVTIAADLPWLTAVIAYGFLARVAAGPRFSPLGLLATRVIAPRLGEPKPVPGPPKRFAQAMGAAMSLAALVLVIVGATTAAYIVLGGLAAAAFLEAAFALCLGCKIFALGMRLGLVPEEVCAECNDIWARAGAA
ncbi:hypothetical protein Afil01_10080 [Actinorhabdospora filicis]|uniref:DUF4395 domain-containing protein n=1 Tax=Actinorhabdospora filicis TaxID=1785913 RepID=A0A9W6SIL4_9ACTN|nr:DUF4395 domain-containing protein [Actinorhabdospora filicis]GLZ76201.1 hypothetical protein Afil01_10080 [Actinorhabdospora filicis]